MKKERNLYGLILIIASIMIFSALSAVVFAPSAQASNMVPISSGFNPKLIHDGTFIGYANENQKIWVTIGLKWKNEESLNLFLKEVNNPNSPSFGKYLTYKDFKSKYAPSKMAYNEIIQWIKSKNVHIEYTYGLRNAIVLHDTIEKIGNLLGVKFGYFKSNNPNYNKEYFAAMNKPKIPLYLKPYISGINGLNNATKFKLNYYTASSGIDYLTGADVAKMYRVYELYNDTSDGSPSSHHIFATGLRVATVLWEGADSFGDQYAPFDPDAINYYYHHVIPTWIQNLGVMSTVDYYGTSGTVAPGSDTDGDVSVENELDLEMVGTLAPGVNAFCVYGPGSSNGGPAESNFPDNEYNYILNTLASERSPILVAVSNSWGGGDSQVSTTTMNDVKALEAMGVTMMASSGDDGDTTSPSEPSTAAYDTYGFLAVGGTTPTPNGVDDTTLNDYATMGNNTNLTNPRSSEIVWYDASSTRSNGDHWGTQSGVSSVYPEPSWQSEYIGSYSGRVTPDVSAMGNRTLIYTSGSSGTQWSTVAGTSVACPVTAGMVAMMDAYIGVEYGISHHGLGFLNPIVYKLGYDYYHNGKFVNSPPYYDVTQGYTGGGGSASTGWDQVSGWGVINAWNFIHDIGFTISASSTSASVNPGDSASYNLNISFPYNWTTDVGHFEISGLPSGATASSSSSYVHPSGNGVPSSLTITIQTSSSTPSGTYPLTFVAYTYNHTNGHWGNLTNSIQLTLTVGSGGTNPTAPSAPQNLQASAGNGYVLLTWQAPSSNGGASITEYKIYRGTTSGGESYLTEVSGNTLSYNDTSVSNGQTYYYYVTAVNSAGESQPSNEVSATPQAPSSSEILLVLDNGSEDYQSYFTQALNADGYSYDIWNISSSGSPPVSILENYQVVIWTTGSAWSNILSSTEQSNLETYLNNGGALYLSSQDFLYEVTGGWDEFISNTFVTNYLGVDYVANDVDYNTVAGVPGTFVQSFTYISLSDYPFTNYADELGLSSYGQALFYNPDDDYVTGDYVQTSTYKTVFTAFSFEAVENTDPSTGNALLKAIINWLSGETTSIQKNINIPIAFTEHSTNNLDDFNNIQIISTPEVSAIFKSF